MIALLFILITSSPAMATGPSCRGVVATPAQRDAYTETMFRVWSKSAQYDYVRNHEQHLKNSTDVANWNRLNDEERMSILQYTGGMFGDLNRQLRSSEFDLWPQFITLCSALNKLPDYQGTVYRILDLSPEQINQIKLKGAFTDPAFMSSSIAQVLVWKKNTLFTITTAHGKRLMGLSSHSEEKEVLLLPRSQFKVEHFKENLGGEKFHYEITLKEVNSLDI